MPTPSRIGAAAVPLLACAALLLPGRPLRASDFPRFEAREIDPRVGNVCYAVTIADVNGDGAQDIVAVTEDAVVWYRNPDWSKHEIVRGQTERDNVCIAPMHIDRDGRIDFALGAGWKPPDTSKPGTLQWLGRDAEGRWQVHPIRYDEPSIHRMRWVRLGRGRQQLVVVPLQGRGTRGPDWGQGSPVNIRAFTVPSDPKSPDWPSRVLDSSLHTVHNLSVNQFDADPPYEIIVSAWEGVFVLDPDEKGQITRTLYGSGNQDSTPFKGASEVRLGWMGGSDRYLATIEPWHGNQVVLYFSDPRLVGRPGQAATDKPPWTRTVIAEPVSWGHALWCTDLDGDPEDEIIVGQRDPNPDGVSPRGPGVYAFDLMTGARGVEVVRRTIDEGGMACEDLISADLDGDGDADIVAGGRATHNVKLYINRGAPESSP